MADVNIRDLLRTELAARQPPKSKASKKRKPEEDPVNVRKKTKQSAGIEASSTEKIVSPDGPQPTTLEAENNVPPSVPDIPTIATQTQPQDQHQQSVDEDQWAAFERDVIEPTKAPAVSYAPPNSAITISAAPVSTTELESRERQDRESLAKAREVEAAGLQEDATRSLEEEFDEMEELDLRVKRLKDKREEIRRRRNLNKEESVKSDPLAVTSKEAPGSKEHNTDNDDKDDEDFEDSEDNEDTWDEWRLLRS
ncbi:hypothetical protein FQN57_001619 [Myotisia sp. PD_48]|nr:hypothetical protein FQN57_001619 [Myotisia sp. PD_48]